MSSGTQLRTKQCDYWSPGGKPAAEVPEVAVEDPAQLPVVNEGPLLPRELLGRGN